MRLVLFLPDSKSRFREYLSVNNHNTGSYFLYNKPAPQRISYNIKSAVYPLFC